MANYSQYINDIVRAEYKNFYPISNLTFNNPNKKIEFNIDFGDTFCTSKFQYFISGTLTKAEGGDYPASSNVKLIDNFVPFLFSRIEARKHNKVIDEIEYAGIVSTIKGTLTYSQTDAIAKRNSGFDSIYSGGGKFFVCGNLGDLGLGFFEDVNIPIYKGGFTLSFTRAEDHDAIYRFKKDNDVNTLAKPGKITINEFIIRVPILDFKTTSKIQLVNELEKLSSSGQNVIFKFRNWQAVEKRSVSGTTFSFDITNIYRNIFNPKFIVVGLQRDRLNNQERKPSEFDHMDVKNIRVKLNECYYPDELQNLSISDGNYAIMYEQYQDYKKVFYKNNEMYYTPKQFINSRPIYVIDTTRHPENISNSKSNIIINIDFQSAISQTDNVIAYIVIISEKVLSYNIITNEIREL